MKRQALAALGLLLQASVAFGSELSDDLSARRGWPVRFFTPPPQR